MLILKFIGYFLYFKGNYLIKQNSKYVITDLTWFSNIIELISTSQLTSDDFEGLSDFLGEKAPILTKKNFEEFLKDHVRPEKVGFIFFLAKGRKISLKK